MVRLRMFSKLLLALMLSSGFSVLLVLFRSWFSGEFRLAFLWWNLFLGWVPLVLAMVLWAVDEWKGHWVWKLVLFWGWLLFFPNAPYLITDLAHLHVRPEMPFWYDLLLFFSYAWNGVVLGFSSLMIIHEVLDRRLSNYMAWGAIVGLVTLNSFGVFLGRFLRWNSWNVLTSPRSLVFDTADQLLYQYSPWRTVGFTVGYTIFLLFAYLQLRLLFKYQNTLHDKHHPKEKRDQSE